MTQLGDTSFTTEILTELTTLDEIAAPVAAVDMDGQKLTGVGTPTVADDVATKGYADAVASGLDVKASVRAATTANITLSGEQTIDGVSVVATDRVLVKNQTLGAANGIYAAAVGAWARSTDADADAEVTTGMFTFVEGGTAHADQGWVLTTANPITVGTTVLAFTQFSGIGGSPSGAAGGVLSGTYPSPGFAADMATQAELDAHTSDAAAAHAASAISASSATLVGTGTDVQAVLEELDNSVADHLADAVGAHAATAVAVTPAGTISSTTVQAALEEIAAEAGVGGADLPFLNLADYVTDFTGATDQTAEVEAALTALPAEGGIIYGSGFVKISTQIDLHDFPFVHFVGPIGGLDNITNIGLWFRTGTIGQTLFNYDAGSLKVTGPQFTRVALHDPMGECTLLNTRDVCRVILKDVTFYGFGTTPTTHTTTGLVLDITPGLGRDSSYHYFGNVNFHACFKGIHVIRCNGFTMNGGLFNNGPDSIGYHAEGGQNIFFSNVSGASGNACWKLEADASLHHWTNCYWESPGSTQPVCAWDIDSGGVGQQGYGHTLIGCHAAGPGGGNTDAFGFKFGTGSHRAYAVIRATNFPGGNVVNNSPDNDVFLQGAGWLTPITLVSSTSATFSTSDTGPTIRSYPGNPEGLVGAVIGSKVLDSVNGDEYNKKSGSGTTGWRLVTQDIQIEVTQRKALEAAAQTTTTAVVPVATLPVGSVASLAAASLGNKTIASVADTKGNTWTVDSTAVDGTRGDSFATAPVTAALLTSDTVTITWSAATSAAANIWLHQQDNLAASPADKTVSASGTSTSPSSGATATLSQAEEIVWCLVRTSADSTFTVGTGFTAAETPSLGPIRTFLEYKRVHATTAVTGNGTLGTSGSWVALTQTYKKV